MLENEGVALRAIRWSEIFPWLCIGKSLRLAISPRLLVFGAAALLLTLVGWWVIAGAFRHGDQLNGSWRDAFGDAPFWEVIDRGVGDRPLTASGPYPMSLSCAWYGLSRPVLRLFSLSTVGAVSDQPMSAKDFFAMVLSCVWSLAVWAYFGAAISRVAAVQLAAGERVGWAALLRWVQRKWLAYFSAPLIPMLGAALAAAPILLLGLPMHYSFFAAVAGFIWPLVLLAAFIMTLLLVGVLLGWPLMWATISVEGTDSFDAISRTYAYVLQRPFRYLAYILFAVVVGWLGWIVVENLAAAVIWLAAWSVSWNAAPWPGELRRSLGSASLAHAGGALIAFWNGCVKLLALGYVFSYFGVASTAIYYQLRRDIDARETDEVFLDADESERSFGLPRIQKDSAGAAGGRRGGRRASKPVIYRSLAPCRPPSRRSLLLSLRGGRAALLAI